METEDIIKSKEKMNEIYYQEFFIIKDNNIYKVILEKNNNKISISSGNYYKNFNLKELSILFKIDFTSINDAFNYLVDLFEDYKVNINNKIKYKEILLYFSFINGKNIEIKLEYEKNHQNNFITNKVIKLENEIKILKNKNDILEKEINSIKKIKVSKENQKKAPTNIKLLHSIEEKSYADYGLNNTFAVFNSFNGILYLVYSTKKKSMICYDLKNHSLISEIKNCHLGYITSIRHLADKINKIDIIMTVSNEENNIKLWNLINMACILDLKEVNKKGFLYSACFLTDNFENFIVSSNYDEYGHFEYLKIFNFKGQKIKEIKKSNEPTFLVESYFDDIFNCQNYIITGNLNFVKSYNYNKNEVYHKYFDKCINGYHYSIIIINQNSVVKLMESCEDGYIRIWHFHGGILLNKIRVCKENINGISLYNDKYLFVGSDDENIRLIDLEEGIVLKKLHAHFGEVLNVEIIFHPKLGNILISQAYEEDEIRIWSINS